MMEKNDFKSKKGKSRWSGQQQQFIPGANATPHAPPVMYHHPPMMYHPMVPQSYQQNRSPQGYYSYMGPSYVPYNTSANHTQPYYYGPNNQQLSTANLQANNPGARNNSTTLVDPQGCTATPVAPAASLPHPQVHTNIHQVMPCGIRPAANKRSHRVPIIDPITQQDILSELYSKDGKRLSNASTEKQTSRPETNPAAHSILEEFSRKISEAAKEPTALESATASNNVSKLSLPSSPSHLVPQLDAINSNNNNITNSKTVTVNENKSLGSDVTPELNEPLVVSAISDSTVIVPKLPINIKEFQKNSDIQPLVQDINENVSPNKQHDHNKNKPVVSQVEKVETTTESVSAADHHESIESISVPTSPAPATTQPELTPVSVSVSSYTLAPAVITGSHPQLQTIGEPIDHTKTDDNEKDRNKEDDTQQDKETSPALNNTNSPTPIDAANGNTDSTEVDIAIEDINKNEQIAPNNTEIGHNKSENETSANEDLKTEIHSYENGNDETDKIVIVEDEKAVPANEASKESSAENLEAPPVFVPKYKYSEDQWFPSNPTGKKCYNIELLKQIKDDPLSKHKPDIPLLESCNIMRDTSIQEPFSMSSITRPHSTESFLPLFVKTGVTSRTNNAPRDLRKDARSMTINSKGSMTLPSNSPHKPKLIRVSLSLREDIKLNVTENAWKPARHKKENLSEEEQETQELYKKFRGILNKITPQKFDTLMNKVKSLNINNQKRLEGVIDLVFEKAIDEPNFSKAYAAMCAQLSVIKVPADNPTTPDQCVNFRALIINRCQKQFVTDKVDERVLMIEKEIAECSDPLKQKELQLQLDEENRKIRMRSVGNVRFIGELYKLKMLTSKIMVYCMNYLIEKLEEEKLECLCKLLTTIGEQVENEVKEQLDNVFMRMQEIVHRKSNMISSRVRFMIQDVIELRKRRWVTKSVVDSQPKTMDQIQREAEQRQREIEIMNASPMGGFRRDDGGRSKRADSRRPNSSFMDNSKRPIENSWKSVDTSKLSKGVMQKSFSNIKLAPQMSGWNYGSGAKMATAQTENSPVISFTKTNKFSVLENVQTDPSSLRGSKDITPSYKKEAATEKSAFSSRDDVLSGDSSLSGSPADARPNSSGRSTGGAPRPAPAPVPQEPLPQDKKMSVKSMIDLSLINPDDNELVGEVTHLFAPQYRAALVTEILNVALEKSPKQIGMIAKSLLHLVSTNTISPDNFVSGLKEIFEFAPDLYIDIPMVYNYLGRIVAPQIEKKHITFAELLSLSGNVVSENHGQLFLKALINSLKDSMGASFIESKWQESGLRLADWMKEDQIAKWIEDNKFQFLEGIATACEETNNISTPAETRIESL